MASRRKLARCCPLCVLHCVGHGGAVVKRRGDEGAVVGVTGGTGTVGWEGGVGRGYDGRNVSGEGWNARWHCTEGAFVHGREMLVERCGDEWAGDNSAAKGDGVCDPDVKIVGGGRGISGEGCGDPAPRGEGARFGMKRRHVASAHSITEF